MMLSLPWRGVLSAIVLSGTALAAPANPDPQAVAGELAAFDEAYRGVVPWVGRLYDPKSGGFYETLGLKEGREDRPYGTDIQSTHFAISILADVDLLKTLPDEVRDGFVRFFQSRQEKETGYFVDPDYPEMKDDPRTLGRALLFSTVMLKKLGAKPLYPLPGQKGESGASAGDARPASHSWSAAGVGAFLASASSSAPSGKSAVPIPPHLASVEAFRAWLDARPWSHSWTALDNLSSQSRLILVQEPVLRDALVDEAMRNVQARQDPKTGLIGGGGLIVQLSGAFKLAMFCKDMGRPIPGAGHLMDRVLEWYRSSPVTDRIFFPRNAADLLSDLVGQTGRKLTADDLQCVIGVSAKELERFRCADGAFCSYEGVYYISPDNLYLSQPRIARAGPQSDLNGTEMAWVMRRTLYRLAGIAMPAVPTDGFSLAK